MPASSSVVSESSPLQTEQRDSPLARPSPSSASPSATEVSLAASSAPPTRILTVPFEPALAARERSEVRTTLASRTPRARMPSSSPSL